VLEPAAARAAPGDSGPIMEAPSFGPPLETDAGDTEVELDDELELDDDLGADLDIDGDLEFDGNGGSGEDADEQTLDEMSDDLEFVDTNEEEVDSDALFEAPGVDLSEDEDKVE